MSAIREIDGALGPDGVRRYHTVCKVIIHSHVSTTFVISQDVTSIGLNKNIKGVGTATLTLVGSKNFLNSIHPNDYINIYLDIGDGEGWTRVFFGFVDIVREKYMVNDSGEPTTQYTVTCSDFQKAFEKTHIYFNPWMSTRKEFLSKNFGVVNIGGVALMTRGITPTGSPADIIRNLIILMFGFGSQFILPANYGAESAVVANNRNARLQFLKGELGTIGRTALLGAGSYTKLKEQISREAGEAAATLAALSPGDRVQLIQEVHGLNPGVLEKRGLDLSNKSDLQRAITDSEVRKALGAGPGSYNIADPGLAAAIGSLEDTKTYSLLDVIDIFSLFEDESIDGWTQEIPIWESQGPLGQILNSVAHEEVNEFFYDLRPVADESLFEGSDYSRRPDELYGNLGSGNNQGGVCYIPHIIFREYPFGTISKIDGSDIHFTLVDAKSLQTKVTSAVAGDLMVGALFSDRPNKPGRHNIVVPAEAVRLKALDQKKNVKRHLDVAVIHSHEIVSSDLARSDSDHFNLFEIFMGDFHLADLKYTMSDILPIATPIHIMRHGLRQRQYQTKFARFNLKNIKKVLSVSESGEIVAAEGGTTPPEPPASDGNDGTEAPPVSVTVVIPVELASGRAGRITSPYGYRTKIKNSAGKFKVESSATKVVESAMKSEARWVYHNGVDIGAPEGTEVRATMDGLAVASVPDGTFNKYGNTIVIKHTAPGFNQPIYSLYAHLQERRIGAENTLIGDKGKLQGSAHEYIAGGTWQAKPVKAGDVIGTVGRTGGDTGVPSKFAVGAHLHFEYNVREGKSVYPSLNKGATPESIIPATVTTATLSATKPGNTNPRSLDPEDVHRRLGVPLSPVVGVLPKEEEVGDAEDGLDSGDDDTIANNPASALPSTEALRALPGVGSTVAAVADQVEGLVQGASVQHGPDTTLTRKQVLRWGLLQDHWYQHNLEYVSGQIIMRGAPEIRCGYRLDIKDRNMSFYVDGVAHVWQFPDNMITTLTVSRGQSNNPHPMYVMPPATAYNPEEQRSGPTRLGRFQILPDPMSVTNAIVFRSTDAGYEYRTGEDRGFGTTVNATDLSEGVGTIGAAQSLAAADGFVNDVLNGPQKLGQPVYHSQYKDYVLFPETQTLLHDREDLDTFLDGFIKDPLKTSLDHVEGQDLEGPIKHK